MSDKMNEELKENLYAMREVPDLLIYIPSTNTHITICHIKNLTHRLNGANSEIRFVNSLMDKRIISNLYDMVEGSCKLYFISSIRSYKEGKDSDYYWYMDNANLVDYKFGVALDGNPSEWTFVFSGDLIKPIGKNDVTKYIFDTIKKDTGYTYNE